MPLIVFNFQSDAGLTQTIQQNVDLITRPPPNARFFLRQVSASTTASYENVFKYVHIYIPQLMSQTSKTIFNNLTVDASNALIPTYNQSPGLRYYLSDPVSQPFAINAFPNLSLGRHTVSDFYMTAYVTGIDFNNTVTKLNAFSIVIEWDTE